MNRRQVLKELNPWHDLDRYHWKKEQPTSRFKDLGWFVLNNIKSAARGGLAGALMFGAAAAIYKSQTGDGNIDILSDSKMGAYAGMQVDIFQHSMRYFINYGIDRIKYYVNGDE